NVDVAFVLNPKLDVDQLLETVCDELGASYIDDKITIKEYIDCLNKHLLQAHSKGRHTVLIIDEAQNLSAEVLEQLRLLTNLETDEKKLLQIVLLGQPELLEMFARPELRQLNQRVTARFHLGPLTRKELSAYVAHRLAVAGSKRPFSIFPDPVLNDLYRYSHGVPRLINVICDRAMLGAYVNETIIVDRTILRKAAKEVMGEQALKLNLMPRWVPWAAGATAATLALAMGVALWTHVGTGDSAAVSAQTPATPAVPPAPVAKSAEASPPPPMVAVDPVVNLEWPSNVPLQQSERLAFQKLFSSWSVSYTDDLKKPCDFAVQKKLACFVSHGTFEKLKSFNMPAILKIQEQNTTFYAVLSALNDKDATLFYAGEQKNIPMSQLKEKWTGEFTLIWQPPPSFKGEIGNGTIGPVVKWLNQQLQW
ncbi:MAG TPA: AAA family ATPase, partial [Pseudomonadales bacterium]|nr:AAA family ATPase [Pseudomonadales bacterium]